jgi:hypothetical protein
MYVCIALCERDMTCYLIEVDNYGNSLSISLNDPLMGIQHGE